MKRMICGLLTAAIFAATCAGLCACKEEEAAEPFAGVASVETYGSAEEAAAAFLFNELGGESGGLEFVTYEKTGDLNDGEISACALSEADKNSLISAEKGEVVYTEEEATSVSSLAANEQEIKRIKMFLLYFQEKCKYYVPPVETGERLTKSYYMSLFDAEKYSSWTILLDVGAGNKYFFEYDGKIIRAQEYGGEEKYEYRFPYGESFIRFNNFAHKSYYELAGSIDGYPVSEIISDTFVSVAYAVGRSYFVKTAEGFQSEGGVYYGDDYIKEASVTAKIINNRVVSFVMSVGERSDNLLTNVNSTKIEIPAEVQALYDEYVKNHPLPEGE